ncbi:retinoid-inducible serine carboxypeptidase-like [Arctopsyche grandis]|uniref:retinoid-inducible serine carboxypeptidase-like n=1 Tax=Arctopsyche grandis TaxID=121162 RepID=UPI00406D92AA
MKVITILVILCLSTVKGDATGFGPGEQDYGYVTIREGAHMFWWLYHTTANVTDSSERPLILWLMGGPSGSSCGQGNFLLVGPRDEMLYERKNTWVTDFNILFVDSPVGVGFSYVDSLRYLNENNKESAADLLELIREFYIQLPKFSKTPFYVFGAGYGSKIGTEFLVLLNDEVKSGNIDSNIKGMSMMGSWISPVDTVLSLAPFLYQTSLIDENGRDKVENHAEYLKSLYDDRHYYQTTLEWFNLLNTIYYVTDGVDFANIITKMEKTGRLDNSDFKEIMMNKMTGNDFRVDSATYLYLLMNGPVKAALNIPDKITWGFTNVDVLNNLLADFMLSVTDTGQLSWINKLKWKNEQEFKNAKRKTVWVNNTMEGYLKQGGGLSFYWLNVAGQDTINENPEGTREFLRTMTGF